MSPNGEGEIEETQGVTRKKKTLNRAIDRLGAIVGRERAGKEKKICENLLCAQSRDKNSPLEIAGGILGNGRYRL